MKKIYLFLCVCALGTLSMSAQNKIIIPDTKDYLVLTGDMHIHTVFSDGTVWPTTRVDEAAAEGVEVLCMTDHIDDRHNKLIKKGYKGDRNESYKIAASRGKSRGVIVIHGGEVSRGMPPGHFNTLFISDAEPIAMASDAQKDHQKGMMAAMAEAQKQNAFCVWNHPHWAAQQQLKVKWHKEHQQIYANGYMHGIEAYNSSDGFSNDAFQWAIDKNLTLISGSDSHGPMFREINAKAGELRPVTLIFAKEASVEGVREALLAHRTAIFADGNVYGSAELLQKLVEVCLVVKSVTQSGHTTKVVFENNSSIPFRLKRGESDDRAAYSYFTLVHPFETQSYGCTSPTAYKAPVAEDSFVLSFDIENFFVAPGKNFNYKVTIQKP